MKFKIYCINLYEREDRYKIMKNQFDKFGLKVHFIRNYKHKNGGRYGCFNSHIQCLKDAKKNKIEVCLIFEDDIELDIYCNEHIKECLKFLSNNKNVELLFDRNCKICYLLDSLNNNFYLGKAMGAHTIFLTSNSVINILKNYKKYINTKLHYDHYLYFFLNKSYVYNKQISKLLALGSNNDNWNDHIFIVTIQKMCKYTCCHIKIYNELLWMVFDLLISNSNQSNDKIKFKLINSINKINYIEGNKQICIEKYEFKMPLL